jgi:hypothetical protein
MKKIVFIMIIGVSIIISSCGNGNEHEFDPALVTEGMSESELKVKLGEPDVSMTIMDETVFTYGKYMVTIKEGKVVSLDENQ